MGPFRKHSPKQETQNPAELGRPALDVANFLIHQSGYTKTPLQIQEMSYFAHGYMLALRNRPLFRDNVESWEHGPVIPSLHHAFKKWHYSPIAEVSGGMPRDFDSDERELLEMILRKYGRYCGYYLSQLAHSCGKRITPWKKCYRKGGNFTIPDRVTKAYYERYLEK